MNNVNRRRKHLREELTKTLSLPDADKVVNRYRTIRYTLLKDYPNLLANKEISLELIKDIVYLDRRLRIETQGVDTEVKEVLEQEYQLNELGAEANYHNNVKQLEANNK